MHLDVTKYNSGQLSSIFVTSRKKFQFLSVLKSCKNRRYEVFTPERRYVYMNLGYKQMFQNQKIVLDVYRSFRVHCKN